MLSLFETLWPGTFWPETFWADTLQYHHWEYIWIDRYWSLQHRATTNVGTLYKENIPLRIKTIAILKSNQTCEQKKLIELVNHCNRHSPPPKELVIPRENEGI